MDAAKAISMRLLLIPGAGAITEPDDEEFSSSFHSLTVKKGMCCAAATAAPRIPKRCLRPPPRRRQLEPKACLMLFMCTLVALHRYTTPSPPYTLLILGPLFSIPHHHHRRRHHLLLLHLTV